MPLPSQRPRTSRFGGLPPARRFNAAPSSGGGMSGRALGLGALVLGLAMLAWWLVQGGSGSSQAPASLASRDAERSASGPGSAGAPVPARGTLAATTEPRNVASTIPARTPQTAQVPAPRQGPTTIILPPAAAMTDTPPAPASSPAPSGPTTSQPASTPTTDPGTGGRATPELIPAGTTGTPGSARVSGRPEGVQRLFDAAEASLKTNRPVEARMFLNRALFDARTPDEDLPLLRQRLTELNQVLVFSPTVAPGDPLVETYTIEPGDVLARLVNARQLGVDWRLIQRVNQLSDPGRIRVGQKLKLVRGPFHAIVDKGEYRLDLYAAATDPDGNRLFIRSFLVGLGEFGSTPLGTWMVREGSKLVDPHWVNPRTGEKFSNTDPKNPIGERWIGLRGTDANTEVLSGYGIHGTIEPQSIGTDASMGCVRMLSGDIELIYEVLVEGKSTVQIVP